MTSYLEKGIFTISLDTELAWGANDKPDVLKSNVKYYEKTRDVIDRLLILFKQYEIPATWAVVGHLFLEQCQLNGGEKHPEIPRSSYPWYRKDWFSADPCTDLDQDPYWYGKDIVDKIISCPVPQEIGCHSFSHILFGDENTKRETVKAELEFSQKLAKELNLELKSFVFPRNIEGYFDELKKAGFRVFRGSEPMWYRRYSSKVQKVFHITDQFFSFTPPVIIPEEKEGLINIQGSMLYLSMDGFRKYIPVKARVKKARKGLKKAAKEKKIFHLWFHPFKLATAPEKLLPGFEKILKEANVMRENGLLEIKTMSDIAKHNECSLQHTKEKNQSEG